MIPFMVFAVVFALLTVVLVSWSSIRHTPRREVGQMRGLPMPYYPAEPTYEIRPSVKGLYPNPEPQTMPGWPPPDYKRLRVVRGEPT